MVRHIHVATSVSEWTRREHGGLFRPSRIGSFEEYHNPPSLSLFVMDADGGNIKPITFTLISDRAKVETQTHAIHPDGSGPRDRAKGVPSEETVRGE